MNDETVPTATPETPALIIPEPHPLRHWLNRVLVCNPFFLASALLLLYGLYRVSIDPNIFTTEIAQLTFNFTSLQFYELLLVITAVVLARRYIWYDASLLVVLENLLVLVPFILISQAALIDQRVVWQLCAVSVVVAALRGEALHRRLRELWPTPGFLALGVIILVVNGALPVLYRHFHETKFGTKLPEGNAWAMNQFAWLVLLPALVALANGLPRPVADGHVLTQRRWFPPAFFAGWLLGTGVHLYCLGYVYDFDLSRHLLAPGLWVLAWTLFRKLPDFANAPAWRAGAMALPLPMALVAAGATGSHVFALLMLANAVGYAGIFLRERDNRVALHLALISLAAAVAGAPVDWMLPRFAGFDRAKLITLAFAAYGVLACALSRNPKVGLLGSALTGLGVSYWLDNTPGGGWWAVQLGFGYLLLHSLRWDDGAHPGATLVRAGAAVTWMVQSWCWVRQGADWPGAMALPVLVLVAVVGWRWWRGDWVSRILPVTAVAAALGAPLNFTMQKVHALPVGVLAIIGSFGLLGLGALAALTKHRWHAPPQPEDLYESD